MIFLDAHVEVTDGWLEPLLAHIVEDRSLVAVPHINGINAYTWRFEFSNNDRFTRFSWDLQLYW